MAARGTLESIALQMAGLFKPLEEEFQVGRIRTLFAELGMEFPPELETKTAFIQALQQTVNKTLQLPEIVIALVQAIEDENFGQITSKGIDLFGNIKTLVGNIKTIADELNNLGGSLPGISASELNAFAAELPRNILDYLIIRNMEGTPGMAEALELFNGIKRETITNGDFSYTKRKIQIDKLSDFISNPAQELKTLYDWGNNSFTGVKLLQTLEKLMIQSGAPAIFDNSGPTPVLDAIFLEVKPKTDINPKGLEITLLSKIDIDSNEFALDDWKIRFVLDTTLEGGVKIIIQPDGNFIFVPPSGSLQGEGFLEWIAGGPNGQPYLLLGEANGSRLEAREFVIRTGVGFAWDSVQKQASGNFTIGGAVNGGKLFIDFSQGDGFLSKILSSIKLESDFDIGFGFSSKDGLFFYGSSTLLIQLPIHISLGPIDLSALTIGIGISSGTIPLSLALDIKAALGPLNAVVEQIGVKADLSFPSNQQGNLGPVDLAFGFKPPKGVGLSLDVGIVKGGGYLFFDFEREEYAGILELAIAEIVTVKAIGLITTKMPDGSKGFSLLLIITAEFGTGIQLGFGFTLLGVGGLLGLNRTMLPDAIAAGIRSGGINSIMFPANPVENAPRIISDLRNYFPPYEGKFLIGPMLKVGWGTPTLVSLSFGLIIEIPGNVAIIGVLRVNLPTEELAIISINVGFIGVLEFDKQRLWFFASLFDSRILFLTLEGDMGLLMDYSDNPNFVLSVGGFHPLFNPPPLPFPNPRRLRIDVLSNPLQRISVECYFAVTSNTVQFGARAELFMGLSVVNISGHFAFDALFQFSPFKFIIEMSFSVSLNVFGIGLFSIHLNLSLEGPTPWRARGTGKLTIDLWLFEISISANFDVTWGDAQNTTLPPVKVLPIIEAELLKDDNWRAQLPASSNLLVSIRKLEGTQETLVLHPLGTLQISQRAVPLNLKIDKVGNNKAEDANTFSMKVTTSGLSTTSNTPQEKFAIAQYQELSNDEKLTRPAFQNFDGGVELSVSGRQLGSSKVVRRVVRYEVIIVDTNFKRFTRKYFSLIGTLFNHFLGGAAVSKSKLSHAYKKSLAPFGPDETIKFKDPGYVVAGLADNKAINQQAVFANEAMARDFMYQKIAENPALAEEVHVIPEFEAVLN